MPAVIEQVQQPLLGRIDITLLAYEVGGQRDERYSIYASKSPLRNGVWLQTPAAVNDDFTMLTNHSLFLPTEDLPGFFGHDNKGTSRYGVFTYQWNTVISTNTDGFATGGLYLYVTGTDTTTGESHKFSFTVHPDQREDLEMVFQAVEYDIAMPTESVMYLSPTEQFRQMMQPTQSRSLTDLLVTRRGKS